MKKAFPLNVPGDFFVEDGYCLICDLAPTEAPSLMAMDEETGHCFFKVQPHSQTEIQEAIDAMDVACCDALFYCGSDESVKEKLISSNLGGQIVKEGTQVHFGWKK